MKILVVDNFDSFTYNLVHYFEALNCEVAVFQNDVILDVDVRSYDKLVLSPGPGLPKESGQLMEFISRNFHHKPILGVCLGMQALADFSGESLYNMRIVKHGISENIKISKEGKLFREMPNNFSVGLYHSWAVALNENTDWEILASSESGVLMAIEHKSLPLFAVQFHPESVLTEYGKKILQNFLEA